MDFRGIDFRVFLGRSGFGNGSGGRQMEGGLDVSVVD